MAWLAIRSVADVMISFEARYASAILILALAAVLTTRENLSQCSVKVETRFPNRFEHIELRLISFEKQSVIVDKICFL